MRVVIILDQSLCSLKFVFRHQFARNFGEFLSDYLKSTALIFRLETDGNCQHRSDLAHFEEAEDILRYLFFLLERCLKSRTTRVAEESGKQTQHCYFTAARWGKMETEVEV